jgi:hypothetical protein
MEIVDLTGGGPYAAKISDHDINRIALPYPAREVIVQKDAPIDTRLSGNNLFISVLRQNYQAAIGVYLIFDGHDPIGLTLIPANMTGETVLLKTPFAQTQKAAKWEQTMPYERTIKELVRKMALSELPTGYMIEESAATQDVSPWAEASLEIVRSYTGSSFKGEVYRLQNTSASAMSLDEDELTKILGRSSARAIAIERRNLKPGEGTRIFLIRLQVQNSRPQVKEEK